MDCLSSLWSEQWPKQWPKSLQILVFGKNQRYGPERTLARCWNYCLISVIWCRREESKNQTLWGINWIFWFTSQQTSQQIELAGTSFQRLNSLNFLTPTLINSGCAVNWNHQFAESLLSEWPPCINLEFPVCIHWGETPSLCSSYAYCHPGQRIAPSEWISSVYAQWVKRLMLSALGILQPA